MKWLQSLIPHNSQDKLNFVEKTDIGGRDNNQDYCAHLFTEAGDLLVVADGLGGHEGGELASRYFCESLVSLASEQIETLQQSPEATLARLIEDAVLRMRSSIEQQHPDIDAHTTCVIAWIDKSTKQVTTGHIGDSRVYIFDSKAILWRSRDHSVVQMLVDIGEVDEADMGQHPEQGSLTRAINMDGEIKPTIRLHDNALADGQALLLCSDGFWEQITTNEICSLAKARTLDKKLGELVKTAVKRGGSKGDNVTAQVWRC